MVALASLAIGAAPRLIAHHGPDRMILNRQQVTLIEPVKDDSKTGQLNAEQGAVR